MTPSARPNLSIMRAFGAFVVACAFALGACSGDDADVRTEGTTSSSSTTSATATTDPSASCALPGADTNAKSGVGDANLAYLTDVRFGRQTCADRVVFEFREGAPGFSFEYQPGPFTFGESGEPIVIAGSSYLVVRLAPAAGVDLAQPDAPATYDGPAQIMPQGLVHVREIRRLSDFEGEILWVIGLDGTRPFTTAALSGPARVYVDVG